MTKCQIQLFKTFQLSNLHLGQMPLHDHRGMDEDLESQTRKIYESFWLL